MNLSKRKKNPDCDQKKLWKWREIGGKRAKKNGKKRCVDSCSANALRWTSPGGGLHFKETGGARLHFKET